MLKSINQWSFPKGTSVKDAIALAAKAGFEAFEPTVGFTDELTFETPKATFDVVRKMIQDAGLQVASLASGAYWKIPPSSADPAIRQQGMDAVRRQIEMATWLGTDAILVVPGSVGVGEGDYMGKDRYDLVYDRVLEALNTLKADAEAAKVQLGVENVWNSFLLSPIEMRDLIDRVNSPFVSVYFDVGNVILFGYSEQWIAILGKRISRIHVKDFRKSVGNFGGFVDLLAGDVNWPAVVEELKAIGYTGPLTAEMGGYKTNGEEVVYRTSAALDAILGRK